MAYQVGLKEGMFHVHFRVVGLLTIRFTMIQVGLKEGMFHVHFRVVGLLTIRFTIIVSVKRFCKYSGYFILSSQPDTSGTTTKNMHFL